MERKVKESSETIVSPHISYCLWRFNDSYFDYNDIVINDKNGEPDNDSPVISIFIKC